MPRLIHLNGASGIGKSTVARWYADRRAGVLDLETDHVVRLIGGWRETFFETFKAAQLLTVSMARTHLRTGHDVVMPQLCTRVHEIEPFERAARESGAEYREILLTAEKPAALARYTARDTNPGVDDVLSEYGGAEQVARIHDQLAAYLALRPACTVIATDGCGPEETYAAVVAALGERQLA